MFAELFFIVTWLWLYTGGVAGAYRRIPENKEGRFVHALVWPISLGRRLGSMAMAEEEFDVR